MLHITCPSCGEQILEPPGARGQCPECGAAIRRHQRSKTTTDEPPNVLRMLAFAFFLVGSICTISFAMMDATVQTEFGRVYNLHAASQKQTGLILSGLACASGLVAMAILANRKD